MSDEIKRFDKMVELIDQAMAKMMSMHSSPQDFGTSVPLYRAEIHTIRAIGENPGINMTRLAEEMGVTKGAVSQTIAKLVRKGLVRRTYASDDAKEVHPQLTDLGWVGFHKHQQYHQKMLDTAREYFGDEYEAKLDMFTIVMNDLNEILDRYESGK